jgi:glycosyltransferase involved in cell wall biosynthesis
MSNPHVAVVIPVFNGSSTIERAIESALAQKPYTPDIIVVDDGSTDQTREMLLDYGNQIKRVRQRRQGPSAARNVGANAAAAAAYVSFLDADDALLPDMIRTMVERLESAPASVLAFSDVIPVDDKGHALDVGFINDWCAHAPSLKELLKTYWPILPSAAVMRRDAFLSCQGFSEKFTSPGFEDPYLWLQMRECGDFEFVDEPLAIYRTTPPLERMLKYAGGYKIFTRLVKDRYGIEGEGLIKEMSAKFMYAWNYEAAKALRLGNKLHARRAFECVLKYGPRTSRFRSTSRWMRTFLPLSLARALSGKFIRRTEIQTQWDYFFETPNRCRIIYH